MLAAAALVAAPAFSPAFAQQAPATAASAAGKAGDSAEATAAMERAQRMASNPMRVILEASRFKRKGAAAEAEPTPEAADANNLRRTAARSVVAESATAPTAAVREEPAVITPRSAPVPKATPVEVFRTTASELDGALPASAVPSLESAAKPAAALFAVPPAAVPTQTLAAVAAMPAPKLLSSVEPVLAGRLLTDAARVGEVLVDLSLRADGSVASAAMVTPVPRTLLRPILDAVEKWRFDPQPEGRTHRVQLVFGEK